MAAALSRAVSWALVTQTGLGSAALAVRYSVCTPIRRGQRLLYHGLAEVDVNRPGGPFTTDVTATLVMERKAPNDVGALNFVLLCSTV
jgi:hypothetical protein